MDAGKRLEKFVEDRRSFVFPSLHSQTDFRPSATAADALLTCEALATSIDVATLFFAALGIAKGTLTTCVFGGAKNWRSETSFFEKKPFNKHGIGRIESR